VFRRFAPAALLFLTAPSVSYAQVNIDQDKTPAHIFASDCAVCHKSTRGLANGRGGSELTGFLAEHYTSSREEAAAMAAYVLAGGGGVGTHAPTRQQNGVAGRASAEAPKTDEARRQAKLERQRRESARLKPAASDHGKPRQEQRSATAEPAHFGAEPKPDGEGQATSAAAPKHEQSKPVDAAPPSAATAAVDQTSAAATKPVIQPAAPVPTAAAPREVPPSAAPPAARDNIPD
jgi:hypothetical protein